MRTAGHPPYTFVRLELEVFLHHGSKTDLCEYACLLMMKESRLMDSLINEVVVSVALEVHGRTKRMRMDCALCDKPYV